MEGAVGGMTSGGGGGGGGVGGSGGGGGGSSGGWRAFDEEGGGGVEAWVLLGCVARARGDPGGAVSMFRRALALDPDCLEGELGVILDHCARRQPLLLCCQEH